MAGADQRLAVLFAHFKKKQLTSPLSEQDALYSALPQITLRAAGRAEREHKVCTRVCGCTNCSHSVYAIGSFSLSWIHQSERTESQSIWMADNALIDDRHTGPKAEEKVCFFQQRKLGHG